MQRSATMHTTPYARKRARKTTRRMPRRTYADPKGEPALLQWTVIVLGYVAGWYVLKWLVSSHPAIAALVATLALTVLALLWFRERYYITLEDLRATPR